MRKLTPEQIQRIKETRRGYGVFTKLAEELGINTDYVKQLWRKLNARDRKCECGDIATVRSSTGLCCVRCARLQAEYEEWQRFHPQGT